MNYEANTTQWKVGDLVLHDADAKRPEMLMKVIGYGRNGECKTQYATQLPMNGNRRTVWRNEIKALHAPSRFGVSVVPPQPWNSATRRR